MEDRMVELTRFTKVSEAEILANLLKSEGIDCYVRDAFMNQIYNGLDLGGVKVELLEKDLERATEIMNVFGGATSDDMQGSEGQEYQEDAEGTEYQEGAEGSEYQEDTEDAEGSEYQEDLANDAAAHARQEARRSRQLTIIGLLIVLLAGVIILLNKYFNG